MSDSPFHPRYWPTWLGIALLRCLGLLPFSVQLSLGKALGILLAKTLKRRRHIAEVNIGICFPELSPEEQQQLVDESIISTTLGLIESSNGWWASTEKIHEISSVEGLELIEQAQNEGRGVLLFGAHFTSLDLSGRVLGSRIEADATYKDQKNKALDYQIFQSRKKYCKNIIHKNEMRKFIRALKDKRVVWYAPDQDFGRKGSIFAPFFGRSCATLAASGKLLKLSNAKPLFYSHYRVIKDGKTHYQGIISDPFNDQFGDDELANATLVNKAIEDAIRPYPDQYLWAHERFRTQQNKDDPKPYTIRKKKKKKKN